MMETRTNHKVPAQSFSIKFHKILKITSSYDELCLGYRISVKMVPISVIMIESVLRQGVPIFKGFGKAGTVSFAKMSICDLKVILESQINYKNMFSS